MEVEKKLKNRSAKRLVSTIYNYVVISNLYVSGANVTGTRAGAVCGINDGTIEKVASFNNSINAEMLGRRNKWCR